MKPTVSQRLVEARKLSATFPPSRPAAQRSSSSSSSSQRYVASAERARSGQEEQKTSVSGIKPAHLPSQAAGRSSPSSILRQPPMKRPSCPSTPGWTSSLGLFSAGRCDAQGCSKSGRQSSDPAQCPQLFLVLPLPAPALIDFTQAFFSSSPRGLYPLYARLDRRPRTAQCMHVTSSRNLPLLQRSAVSGQRAYRRRRER